MIKIVMTVASVILEPGDMVELNAGSFSESSIVNSSRKVTAISR